MDMQLTGKIAMVTGGTAGIGLEIARQLAFEGAHVVVTGRNQAKLDQAIKLIQASDKVRVSGLLADVGTGRGAAEVTQAVESVDILINNLGIYESKAFADVKDADWTAIFETNVMSGVRLSRHYLPTMIARNWGRIIFISSESGLAIPGDMIHYGMTKGAQLSVSRGLAQLTRGTGVTVNSVMPGPTRSAGIEAFLRSQAPDPDASLDKIEADFFATARPTSILQRMIEAGEIANLVAYLASPRSSATNGAALRAEGGLINTSA